MVLWWRTHLEIRSVCSVAEGPVLQGRRDGVRIFVPVDRSEYEGFDSGESIGAAVDAGMLST
jgi:hypothetical protein